MEEDDRFKHLLTDPRFKNMRKKQRKVQIDKRFASMFTDKKFTLKYTNDKRGRVIKKSGSEDLKKYYQVQDEDIEKPDDTNDADEDEDEDDDDDEDDEDDEQHAVDVKANDDDGDDPKATDESELSSSSDESSSEDEEEPEDQVKYNWDALDEDAPTTEDTTKRIALCNFDWDYLNATDIFVLVSSFKQPISVKIYMSEFGKQRLAEEEKHGPKELVEMPRIDEETEEDRNLDDLKSKLAVVKGPRGMKKSQYVPSINQYEDADELTEEEREIAERIRVYQINRLKYYYAVVEMDSSETANSIYTELDGMEYEGSSSALDLRFIPDDTEFDETYLKSECKSMPDLASYEAPAFINTALQQTKVSLTWDDGDHRRKTKLKKSYTMQELEKNDLDAYLASDTDSEDDDLDREREMLEKMSDNEEEGEKMNKYRRLLKNIEKEEAKKDKVDLEVEWDAGLEGEQEPEVDAEDEDEDDLSHCSDPLESDDDTRGKKKKSKGKKKHRKIDPEEDPELELMLTETDKSDKQFNFNPEDERFGAVYDSHLYNIDPSDRRFKRTKAYDEIAKRKRKKNDNR